MIHVISIVDVSYSVYTMNFVENCDILVIPIWTAALVSYFKYTVLMQLLFVV